VLINYTLNIQIEKHSPKLNVVTPYGVINKPFNVGENIFIMENQEEIWVDIAELNCQYQISNKGNLRGKERIAKSSIQKSGFRVIAPKAKAVQDNGNGYKQIYVQIERKRILLYVHRIVAKYFIDNPLGKNEVNHKDGNKANNHVENLEWCSKKENVKHAIDLGLIKKGEKVYCSKLTESNVLAIRRLFRINPMFNKSKVASKFNVKDTTIHKIIKNQRWKHI